MDLCLPWIHPPTKPLPLCPQKTQGLEGISNRVIQSSQLEVGSRLVSSDLVHSVPPRQVAQTQVCPKLSRKNSSQFIRTEGQHRLSLDWVWRRWFICERDCWSTTDHGRMRSVVLVCYIYSLESPKTLLQKCLYCCTTKYKVFPGAWNICFFLSVLLFKCLHASQMLWQFLKSSSIYFYNQTFPLYLCVCPHKFQMQSTYFCHKWLYCPHSFPAVVVFKNVSFGFLATNCRNRQSFKYSS